MENGGGNSGKFLREIEVRDDLKFIQIRMPWKVKYNYRLVQRLLGNETSLER